MWPTTETFLGCTSRWRKNYHLFSNYYIVGIVPSALCGEKIAPVEAAIMPIQFVVKK